VTKDGTGDVETCHDPSSAGRARTPDLALVLLGINRSGGTGPCSLVMSRERRETEYSLESGQATSRQVEGAKCRYG